MLRTLLLATALASTSALAHTPEDLATLLLQHGATWVLAEGIICPKVDGVPVGKPLLEALHKRDQRFVDVEECRWEPSDRGSIHVPSGRLAFFVSVSFADLEGESGDANVEVLHHSRWYERAVLAVGRVDGEWRISRPKSESRSHYGWYDFIGDTLTEAEKKVFLSVQRGQPGFRIPVLVERSDIDGDGERDIVTFQSAAIRVFLQRGASLEHYESWLGRDVPLYFVDRSKMQVVSGLNARSEVFLKIPDACYVAYLAPHQLNPSIKVLGLEGFKCEDPDALQRHFRARDECLAAGGSWGPRGFRRTATCVRKMADAGKPCRDVSECQSKCLYTGPRVPLGTEVTGQCSATNQPFGCFPLVRDGHYRGSLCVD